MKRTLFWIVIPILSLMPLAAQTVTLTSPNGGENWTIGSTATITWNSSGVNTVRLILHQGGTGATNRLGIIAQGLNAASGSYSWTVGSYDTGTAGPGNDYYIRLKAEGADVEDFNNAVFALSAAPQPHFTLFSPNGGESWEKGSDHAISWTAANMAGTYRLLLLKDDQVLGTIKDALSGNGAASIPWKVGDYLGGSATVMEGGYRIRIESVGGQGQYSDDSDNPFTITAQPIIIAPLAKVEVQRMLPARPDLIVCLNWNGKIPYIYQDQRVHVRVKNIGPGNAPASTFKIHVEAHGDQVVQVPALAPQMAYHWSKKYDWKTCGHKTVRATVDPDGQLAESNESNNVVESSIKVSCGEIGYLLEMINCSDPNQHY